MHKFKSFIKNNYYLIFIGALISYIAIIFISLLIKYKNFEYNGLDLAIFNQVFFHSSQGRLFYFTIHPHSYLGDHFTPFLLLLLPFYSLFQSPLTLLLLQTIIIALCTLPIYFLAKHTLNKTWALLLALLWLINPIVINMNFFEFHLLPFAMFFLLFTIYFYQKKKFNLFILFSLLSLSVREDVFLVIFMFAILALFQKRKIKWFLSSLILSLAWFFIAQIIIKIHNPLENYKFLAYYNWLGGDSIFKIALNYLKNPFIIIKHLFIYQNLSLFITLLMPFAFLPLIKPKYLSLSFLTYLQYALTRNGGGKIIIKTHYSALILPGIIASLILAIKSIYNSRKTNNKILNFLKKHRDIILIIFIITHVYTLILFSPFGINKKYNHKEKINKTRIKIKRELLNSIPKYEAIASSYEFLAPLSTRPKIYSLNYAWSGYKQLSFSPYQIPENIEYLYIDFDDVLKYFFQYNQTEKNIALKEKKYQDTYLNWQKLFNEYNLSPLKIIDTYSIWKYDLHLEKQKTNKKNNPFYEIISQNKKINIQNKEKININNEINFLGWSTNSLDNLNQLEKTKFKLMPISLYFQKNTKNNINNDYQLQLTLKNTQDKNLNYSKIYPLSYGFYPSSKWQNNEIIKINYWFLIPQKFQTKKTNYSISLVRLEGNLKLGRNLSIIKNIEKKEILKPDIPIVW